MALQWAFLRFLLDLVVTSSKIQSRLMSSTLDIECSRILHGIESSFDMSKTEPRSQNCHGLKRRSEPCSSGFHHARPPRATRRLYRCACQVHSPEKGYQMFVFPSVLVNGGAGKVRIEPNPAAGNSNLTAVHESSNVSEAMSRPQAKPPRSRRIPRIDHAVLSPRGSSTRQRGRIARDGWRSPYDWRRAHVGTNRDPGLDSEHAKGRSCVIVVDVSASMRQRLATLWAGRTLLRSDSSLRHKKSFLWQESGRNLAVSSHHPHAEPSDRRLPLQE